MLTPSVSYVLNGSGAIEREGGTERVHEYSYIGSSEALSRELRRDGKVATYDYSSSGERIGQRMRDGAGDDYAG